MKLRVGIATLIPLSSGQIISMVRRKFPRRVSISRNGITRSVKISSRKRSFVNITATYLSGLENPRARLSCLNLIFHFNFLKRLGASEVSPREAFLKLLLTDCRQHYFEFTTLKPVTELLKSFRINGHVKRVSTCQSTKYNDRCT